MALIISACATGSPDGTSRRGDPLGSLIGRETGQRRSASDFPPGPSPERFVGGEVLDLDRFLGEPALVRAEGNNEFRRYDLERCRVYAIVTPAGGNVQTISTGPLVSGEAAPSFSSCTSGL